jgi:hypothetical protein
MYVPGSFRVRSHMPKKHSLTLHCDVSLAITHKQDPKGFPRTLHSLSPASQQRKVPGRTRHRCIQELDHSCDLVTLGNRVANTCERCAAAGPKCRCVHICAIYSTYASSSDFNGTHAAVWTAPFGSRQAATQTESNQSRYRASQLREEGYFTVWVGTAATCDPSSVHTDQKESVARAHELVTI